jgi:NDP-sugar pyrophosphorylase family protein
MRAMILAAGLGTRLRPLTNVCPKPMLPIAGRPLIEHTLEWLYRYGVRDVAMNLHYLPETITEAIGGGSMFGMRVRYAYEEQLLGTAGALKRMAHFFDSTFVVVHGDLLVDIDLAGLVATHRRQHAAMTVIAKPRVTPHAPGQIVVDRWGRVVRAADAAAGGNQLLQTAGIYIMEPEVIAAIPEATPYSIIHDLLPVLLASDAPVYAREPWGYLRDINSHAAYTRAQEDWALNARAFGV